jgi:hypothetical protein
MKETGPMKGLEDPKKGEKELRMASEIHGRCNAQFPDGFRNRATGKHEFCMWPRCECITLPAKVMEEFK